jgi:hypothetical protein
MCRGGPYGESRKYKAEAAQTEEDHVYPYQLQSMAVERARDLRQEATAATRARQARGTRVATRSIAAVSHAGARLVRRTAHP